MAITTTSIAFILLSLGLLSCGVWLFKSFQKDGGVREYGRVGYLLSLFFLVFGFQNGIMGFGALLFAKNSEALYFVLIASHIFLAVIALLGVYIVYDIFSYRLLSYFGMALTGMLGIGCVATAIVTHPRPFITLQNGIEWNMNLSLSLLVFYMLFISIGSSLYIFTRLFLTAKTREVKNFSLILSVSALLGIIFAFIRLILLYNADMAVRTRIYDFGIIVVGALFIIAFLIVPIIINLIQTKKQKTLNSSEKL